MTAILRVDGRTMTVRCGVSRRECPAVLSIRYGACVAALASVFLSHPCLSQQEFARPDNAAGFELSISQAFDEASKPLIVVSASIPYRRLVFFVRGPLFEARYRVYLELENERGKRVQGEVWEESVTTADFRETTSASLMASVRRTFSVAAGEYRATVTIEVIDTSRRFSQQETVRIVGDGAGRLEISEPVFYTLPGDSLSPKPRVGEIAIAACPAEDGKEARINPGAVYGDPHGWARVTCNLAIPSAKERIPVTVSVRVRNTRGVVVLYNRYLRDSIAAAHAVLCFNINYDAFTLGEYEMGVVAQARGGIEKSESQGRFTVLFNEALLGEHFDDLVEILTVIATAKELEDIKGAPLAERMSAWANFWRKRDPSPSTESNEAYSEFLLRLKEVLRSFSRFQPGWRTDMGKTYLLNGQPDKIESRQDARLARNYQLWYYYAKGIVYVFEDISGSGDYHLFTTEMI
jgi:GWxTD domain-containing protein